MKLELSVSRKNEKRTSPRFKKEPIFSVVDLDKAESYPRNFVCLLPKTIQTEGNPPSKFPKIYGKESNRIAVMLLTNALRSEGNLEVRAEIEKRLKALEPKPTAKCEICGCTFEPRRYGHFLQRICTKCRYKDRSSQ